MSVTIGDVSFNNAKDITAVVVMAQRFNITEEEAQEVFEFILNPDNKEFGFITNTAGLRKIVNYKTGLIVAMNSCDCTRVEDAYFYKTKIDGDIYEFAKILGEPKWKRCESTGLWWYDKKPPMTCHMSLCRACEPFFKVRDCMRYLVIKFYFWDPSTRDFFNYMRFYQRFYELAKKDKEMEKKPYSFMICRLMFVRRHALGDYHFRYSLTEDYINGYIESMLSAMWQLESVSLDEAVTIVNTLMNDTIVPASKEEVQRWIDQHCYQGKEIFCPYFNETMERLEFAEPEQLYTQHRLRPRCVPHLSCTQVHYKVPVGMRVSNIRFREYVNNTREKRLLLLEPYNEMWIYVYCKDDWYVPIPAGIEIESPLLQFVDDEFDYEEYDDAQIELYHDYTDGLDVSKQKGDKLDIGFFQLQNFDDYQWDHHLGDQEQPYYCFRVKVKELAGLYRSAHGKQDCIQCQVYFNDLSKWKPTIIGPNVANEIFIENQFEDFLFTDKFFPDN